jgi:hypothetical protein
MRRIRYLFFILMFLFPINTHAHVIIFYRYKPMIYEISHRSIVIYDRDNQKVGLIPQISFRGEPEDFCIVVPTPTAPRLNTVSREAFYEAEQLTSSIRRERGTGCLFSEDILGGAEEEAEFAEGIDIISEQSVGIFDAVTLSATDPDALVNWLQENEYDYLPQDKDIIDYYIQRGWVFTVITIPPEPGMSEYYRYNINPVLFRYSASSLIYPMRLSSINAGDRTDIVTYVLADSKMTFPGARIEYANRIDDKELEEILERYPAFGGLIGGHRYLTKLKRTFSIMEMDTDIEIVPAPDSEEFRKVIYYGVSPATDFIPLGIVAAFFLAFRTLSKRKKHWKVY